MSRMLTRALIQSSAVAIHAAGPGAALVALQAAAAARRNLSSSKQVRAAGVVAGGPLACRASTPAPCVAAYGNQRYTPYGCACTTSSSSTEVAEHHGANFGVKLGVNLMGPTVAQSR